MASRRAKTTPASTKTSYAPVKRAHGTPVVLDSEVCGGGHREDWPPGSRPWFEYHCNESDDSPDAPAWHRSHQQVTVLNRNRADEEANGVTGATYGQRRDTGCPATYLVRFDDGLEWTVFEDELMTSREHFHRPHPPTATDLDAVTSIR